MKTIRTALLSTLVLFGIVWVAFLFDEKYGFSRGANDLDQTLFTFVFSILAIGISFLRSLYQAIRVDESYWLVAVLHVVFTCLVIYYFST